MSETAAMRRRRRSRLAIAEVAVQLFAERGYGSTSTEQVAAAADVSRSTLFRYFADKDDLVFAIEDDLLAAAAAAVHAAAAEHPPWPALHQATKSLAAEVTALSEVLLARERVIATSPALQARGAAKHRRWEATLAQALLDSYPLDRHDALLLAKLAVACFEVAQDRWLEARRADCSGRDGASDLARLLQQAFDRIVTLPRL